jgi:hypothetical protein
VEAGEETRSATLKGSQWLGKGVSGSGRESAARGASRTPQTLASAAQSQRRRRRQGHRSGPAWGTCSPRGSKTLSGSAPSTLHTRHTRAHWYCVLHHRLGRGIHSGTEERGRRRQSRARQPTWVTHGHLGTIESSVAQVAQAARAPPALVARRLGVLGELGRADRVVTLRHRRRLTAHENTAVPTSTSGNSSERTRDSQRGAVWCGAVQSTHPDPAGQYTSSVPHLNCCGSTLPSGQ